MAAYSLFNPFFRLEAEQSNGVGLGLSLVKKIIALHQGEISAENSPLGLKISIVMPPAARDNGARED